MSSTIQPRSSCSTADTATCGAMRTTRFLPAAGLVSADQGKLRRNVGIGGVTFRPTQKHIGLGRRGSGRQRRRVLPDQLVQLSEGPRARRAIRPPPRSVFPRILRLLNNQNPVPGVKYEYQAQQESLSFLWAPERRQELERSRVLTAAPRCIRISAIWSRRP